MNPIASASRTNDSRLGKGLRFAESAFSWLTLICFSVVAYGQTAVPPKEPPAIPPQTSQSTGSLPRSTNFHYIIAADDLLDIYVIDVPELSREYRVSPDGSISLPLLSKPITASGLTPDQLSSVIAARLNSAGMVTHASVMVTVKASLMHSVAITGAVNRPQVYPIFGETDLVGVLAQAGGLSNDASDTAVITRGKTAIGALGLQDHPRGKSKTSSPTIKVDLSELYKGNDPESDVPIYPGDTVTVLRAGIVYVVGAVNRAGGYTLAGSWQNMTILKAIALAGNVTSTAKQKKAVIIRKDSSAPGGHEQIRVNLKKILAGQAPDRSLEANDILFVPDSTGKKAFRQGAQAMLGVATGLLIYRAP